MESLNDHQTVDAAIRRRATIKVLSPTELAINDIRATVTELLEVAGWAPFHRPCDASHQHSSQLDGMVPWRMYALDANGCRQLRELLPEENAGKLPSMLASADAMIQATWLPNPPSDEFELSKTHLFEPTLANMEHLAAASAAIQNLLVAATARGIRNYWSSGGALLRGEQVFQQMGIPDGELLLGSLFLFPQETANAQVVGSKLRAQRPAPGQWTQWVELKS
ncbi:nitroreductase family protein [Aureliella helgolandensis]|uniref:Nitroreductase family protein n=1 Tax=Aureliella helgolandensis TaxID=2527968 RepID=A0A518G433_9BACT|nr:nitroreductase family protein [Aureliella helgolandensis]QDV23320.1 Nitroreductase family protein [Aureliella helgolandensis]